MTLMGSSLIAGSFPASGQGQGEAFFAVNPATGETLQPAFLGATSAEVAAAAEAAAAAAAEYRTRSGADRAQFLETIATQLEALGDTLLQRAHAESGLPLARLTGERARTCGQLRLFAGLAREGSWVDPRIDPALPNRQPLPRPDLRRLLIPIGPVAVFGASNFPLAFSVAGGDTASALAAGCPVVVKGHPAHPGTSELVAGAIAAAAAQCQLPPGVFSLVQGSSPAVSIALVKHPAIAAVGFTGSTRAGRALYDAAATRPEPIPVFAEMSSVNPVVLLPGALGEKAAALAQGLFDSFTLGVGQFCTKPGLVFALAGPDTDAFAAKLAELVRGSKAGVMLTRSIREAFLESRSRLSLLSGLEWQESGGKPDLTKAESVPTLALTDTATFLAHPELGHEAFGPFTLIVRAQSPEDLAAGLLALEGQLTATVHGTAADLAAAGPLIALLEQKAGRIVVNGFPTGVEVSPAMNHGGPYPASTDVRFTSVGTAAIHRFARPVCYQNLPDELLPAELRNANPLGLLRLVNGAPTRDPLA